MTGHHGTFLLLLALGEIVVLILLIARFKLNPFIALMTISLALAATSGMPLSTIVKSFETGVGGTLGHIAIVVALGTMLGKMMAESGGAERIALTLINIAGEKNIHWAMMVVGLPMVAGLSVVHGLVPPHPATLLAVAAYNADLGRTVFWALLVGIPTAIVAGPLYAKLVAPRIRIEGENPIAAQFLETAARRDLPSFNLTLFTILLPIFLMLIGSWADRLATPHTRLNDSLRLLGNADMALLIAAMVSFVTLGKLRGFTREAILKFTDECLAPTAT